MARSAARAESECWLGEDLLTGDWEHAGATCTSVRGPESAAQVSGDGAARRMTELVQLALIGRAIARISGVGRSTIARLMSARVNNMLNHWTTREDILAAILAAQAVHAPELRAPVSSRS